jgi:D-alanyl-D-alanine carboxypeptidase
VSIESTLSEILMQSVFAVLRLLRQDNHCKQQSTVIGGAVARMIIGIGVGAIITGIAVAAPQTPSSQNLFTPGVARALDATIARIIKRVNLPSVAVLAAIPDRGRYAFVGGVADLRTRAPRRFEQPFRIASITKTFVATAVLQLVDRGQLQKTDLLKKWFPDFPNSGEITVDDLLRMRSGIAAQSDEEIMDAIYDHPTVSAPTLAQQMAESAKRRDQFKPPDQEGVYTNLNYFILGGIVQKITGADVGVFITDNIIHKLGLRQTSYPTRDDLPGGLHGYGWNPMTGRFDDKTKFNPALGGSAGAMISSLDELGEYVRVLCTGGLLRPETQRARMEGQALNGTTTQYGEGVITGPHACGHSGTVPGFGTDMYYFAERNATLVINVNRLDRDDKPQTSQVLKAVSDTLAAQFDRH